MFILSVSRGNWYILTGTLSREPTKALRESQHPGGSDRSPQLLWPQEPVPFPLIPSALAQL